MEGIVTDRLTLQTGQEELHTKDHQQDTNKDHGLLVNRLMNDIQSANNLVEIDQETDHEKPEAQGCEKTQRATQVRGRKQNVQQVNITLCKRPGTKLGDTELTRVML